MLSCTTVLHLALISALVDVTVILLQWCRAKMLLHLVTYPSDSVTKGNRYLNIKSHVVPNPNRSVTFNAVPRKMLPVTGINYSITFGASDAGFDPEPSLHCQAQNSTLCCIAAHIYIYKYMRNIIKHNDELQCMNERTHYFIKYISHSFFLEKVDVGFVWEDGLFCVTRTDCYFDPSSSDSSSTSSSSWLGLLNRGSLRAQSPPSAAGSQFGILSPTDSNCNWNSPSRLVIYCFAPGYIIV